MPRSTVLAAALVCAACGSVAPDHPDHFDSVTVTVTDTGLAPADVVHVPRFGTVVFRSAVAGAPIDVAVARPIGGSAPCSTLLGFADEGGRSAAHGIAGAGFASLCFHDAGRFPFVVEVGGRELHGTVVVDAEVQR
ncbi:MAG: hypothetical protein IPM29_22625 [Planctomycetes bacterium]|nr:hypothetical protein [Planctomycetota bacterium]